MSLHTLTKRTLCPAKGGAGPLAQREPSDHHQKVVMMVRAKVLSRRFEVVVQSAQQCEDRVLLSSA